MLTLCPIINCNVILTRAFFGSLPFGVVSLASIFFLVKPQHSVPTDHGIPEWKRIAGLDWIGSALLLGTATSVLLPLQWGGVTKAWGDKSVIASFCVVRVGTGSFCFSPSPCLILSAVCRSASCAHRMGVASRREGRPAVGPLPPEDSDRVLPGRGEWPNEPKRINMTVN